MAIPVWVGAVCCEVELGISVLYCVVSFSSRSLIPYRYNYALCICKNVCR